MPSCCSVTDVIEKQSTEVGKSHLQSIRGDSQPTSLPGSQFGREGALSPILYRAHGPTAGKEDLPH